MGLLTERRARRNITPPFALGYDSRCTHYIRVYECTNCGLTGNNYAGMGMYNPCPSCGERKVEERTGRWVPSRGWLWWKVPGYWMIKEASK